MACRPGRGQRDRAEAGGQGSRPFRTMVASSPLAQRIRPTLLLALAAGLLPTAHADDAWPTRPVRWVVPFPAGGAMEAMARILGEKAGRRLGQPFVIENKPGAGGNIGAETVARAPADGYTIMITSIGMATNKALYPKPNYDPVKDFAPVSLLAVVPTRRPAGAG